MRGGNPNVSRQEIIKIQNIIECLGFELATKHQTEPDIFEKEKKLTPKQIFERDLDWIKESDFCIFEISNPSLGVGSEISDALVLGKPVLCLFRKDLEETVSAYIQGKAKCFGYQSLEDIRNLISIFVKSI